MPAMPAVLAAAACLLGAPADDLLIPLMEIRVRNDSRRTYQCEWEQVRESGFPGRPPDATEPLGRGRLVFDRAAGAVAFSVQGEHEVYCDGETLTVYWPPDNEFVRTPAPDSLRGLAAALAVHRIETPPVVFALLLGHGADPGPFHPDARLIGLRPDTLAGAPCDVIIAEETRQTPWRSPATLHEYWFDRASRTLLQVVLDEADRREVARLMVELGHFPENFEVRHSILRTRFLTTQADQPIDPQVFRFNPPDGSRLMDSVDRVRGRVFGEHGLPLARGVLAPWEGRDTVQRILDEARRKYLNCYYYQESVVHFEERVFRDGRPREARITSRRWFKFWRPVRAAWGVDEFDDSGRITRSAAAYCNGYSAKLVDHLARECVHYRLAEHFVEVPGWRIPSRLSPELPFIVSWLFEDELLAAAGLPRMERGPGRETPASVARAEPSQARDGTRIYFGPSHVISSAWFESDTGLLRETRRDVAPLLKGSARRLAEAFAIPVDEFTDHLPEFEGSVTLAESAELDVRIRETEFGFFTEGYRWLGEDELWPGAPPPAPHDLSSRLALPDPVGKAAPPLDEAPLREPPHLGAPRPMILYLPGYDAEALRGHVESIDRFLKSHPALSARAAMLITNTFGQPDCYRPVISRRHPDHDGLILERERWAAWAEALRPSAINNVLPTVLVAPDNTILWFSPSGLTDADHGRIAELLAPR